MKCEMSVPRKFLAKITMNAILPDQGNTLI